MSASVSEVRDGMQVDWDVPIRMRDGVVLRADIFRPLGNHKVPVIMSYGPYAKGLDFREGYKSQWARVVAAVPEILEGSSNKYQNWELVDPERWVPEGYACVRVDSRGAGRSPGLLDCWSPIETQDFHECIEWAGNSNLYITSHKGDIGTQRLVHEIYCPALAKTGVLSLEQEITYRGHVQSFWKLNVVFPPAPMVPTTTVIGQG